MDKVYDLIIIGAGPAGLSAGIYAGERNLDTLILEANTPGGQPATLYPQKPIYDCPPLPYILAGELAQKMAQHAQKMGVVIQTKQAVRDIGKNANNVFEVKTDSQCWLAKAVLLAVGMGFFRPRKLGIAGENLKGVYYVFPEANEIKGKKVLVVGGGETALEGALTGAKAGAVKVYLVHRREEFRGVEKTLDELMEKGVVLLTPCELIEIREVSGYVKKAVIVNNKTQEKKTLEVGLVYIHIGFIPEVSLIDRWGFRVENKAVVVDKNFMTSQAGIFACGDVTIPAGEYKRITIAQGQAAQAVHGAYKYLKQPYWK